MTIDEKKLNVTTHSSGWSINICNDTVLKCRKQSSNNENDTGLYYNSSAIYRDEDGYCFRVAGSFFKNHKNYSLIYTANNVLEYRAFDGDICSGNIPYKMTYKFWDSKFYKEREKVEFQKLDIPDPKLGRTGCERTLDIYANFEDSTEYLLIQRFMNDYWYFTGPVFFLLGIYLMILATNTIATKFVINVIFGEILSFTIACGMVGLSYKYLEWILFVVGLILGIFIGIFSLKGNKLFKTILSITAGYILGILIFDILFLYGRYQLSEILLTDSIIVFIGLAVISIHLAPDYHYFCDSIIGGYLFIRGLTILIQYTGKYGRYRELQLILYLINNYEFHLVDYCFKNYWPIYYVYEIFIVIFISVSMFYYFVKAIGKDEDEEEENEKNPEEKLIGAINQTSNEDNPELD